MPQDPSKCSHFGCTNTHPATHEALAPDGRVVARYCPAHAGTAQSNKPPGYSLREIGKEAPPPQDLKAPPDAVYDEEPPESDWSDAEGAAGPQPTPPAETHSPDTKGVSMAEARKPSTEETSTNFFYRVTRGDHTFDAQMTVRGAPTPDELTAHVTAALTGMAVVVQLGGVSKTQALPAFSPPAQTATPAPPPAEATPTTGSGSPPSSAPTASAPAPAGGPGGGEQVLQATKITIEKRTDGKVTVGFWAPNARGRFPSLSYTREPDRALALLKQIGAWTETHVSQSGTYDNYPCKVYWEESDRTNPNTGKPYKNVLRLGL